MTISERIIKVLKERNMTQVEFAKQIGIATNTISEWKKKKTNPTVEKIMDICNVLQITPEQLLTGKGIEDEDEIAKEFYLIDNAAHSPLWENPEDSFDVFKEIKRKTYYEE